MALHNFIRNLHREDHDFLQWQNTEEYRVDDDDDEEEEDEEEHVAYEPTGDRAMEALRDNITNECNRAVAATAAVAATVAAAATKRTTTCGRVCRCRLRWVQSDHGCAQEAFEERMESLILKMVEISECDVYVETVVLMY
ncbi:hypothetical protein AXX17_AT3G39500 [Arabidopsis thaliana]|uniref:Uncharacterized protein n=1 Tax=Arabidopsis thaliana TaxID=3702 RepID=A0A178VB85_ARATH|nr:hypothetical protein AXX17_AT3G39500 [Arabidopsis thaliana]